MASTRQQPRLGRLAGVLLRTQPDDRLVAMARDGGRGPFEEIVRRHRPALLTFAGSLAPPSRAEDVVQDSLLKAYAALQEGAEPEALRAWLFRIVRNTAIDQQRGTRHHEQLDENYDGVEQPPEAHARREQISALLLAIHDLPAAQREAIIRRELEGRGHEEIGRALQLSPGAVRQLIYRARHSLREAAGAAVPVIVVRAASMRGADETLGGLGIAGAVKVGLAAVAVTGTIVAGAAIGRHDGPRTAEALELSTPRESAESTTAVADIRDRPRTVREHENGSPGRRSGPSGSGTIRTGSGSGSRTPSGNPGGGQTEQSGSGGDDSNEGPGSESDDSSESESGSGSGISGDDGESSEGGTGGTGSGGETTSGEGSGSGSDDGDLTGTEVSSSSGDD